MANLVDNGLIHGRRERAPGRGRSGRRAGGHPDHRPRTGDPARRTATGSSGRSSGSATRRTGVGVGLGLAVARGFVEAVGGELDVEDTPGGGCTMVVRIPESVLDDSAGSAIGPGGAPTACPTVPALGPSGPRRTRAVTGRVPGHATRRRRRHRRGRCQGAGVRRRRLPAAGPDHQPQRPRLRGRSWPGPARRASTVAAHRHPDVVLLDLGLPGIDGVEVVRGIRGWSTVPIIVLSARHQSAEQGGGARRRGRRLRDQALRDGRTAGPAAGRAPADRRRDRGTPGGGGGIHRRPGREAGDPGRRGRAPDTEGVGHRRGPGPQSRAAWSRSDSSSTTSGVPGTRPRPSTCGC